MGLFGPSKIQIEIAEKKVKQAFAENPLLDDIITTLLNRTDENPWILNCTGYYDKRQRTIIIGRDLLGVVNGRIDFEGGEPKEPKTENLLFSYTASGYKPLHSYVDENGDTLLELNQVMNVWRQVICDRMKQEFPDIKFGAVILEGSYVTVSYYVPALTWKDWF